MNLSRPGQPPSAMRVFVLYLALITAAVLPDAIRAALEQPFATLGWVLLVSLAGLRSLWLTPGTGIEFSVRTPVSAGLAAVLSPPMALFVNLVALVSRQELRKRHNVWMIAFNHLQLGICAYLASIAAGTVDGPVLGALAAVSVYAALNAVLTATATWLLGRRSPHGALRAAILPFPWFATNYAVIGLLAVLLVVLLREVGAWAVWLVVVPMWLGFAALHSGKQASDRAEELAARVRELEVLSQLGTALLSTRNPGAVAALATDALRDLCAEGRSDVAVDLEGRVPAHLETTVVPGTSARVGLPPGLGPRRTAEASTVLSAVGLALQRLATEDELREAQQAQAALAERILAEGAIARSRVALHVHDDVLPFLAAAQIQADNAISALDGGDPALSGKLGAAVRDAIADGIRTLREVLDDLQRQALLPGNLLPWLRSTGERLRFEHGLRVSLDVEEFASGISHPVEVLLAESVNGLLANVVQHACASEVTVRLHHSDGAIHLELSDDGIGFDPDRVRDRAHGLALLRQRVELVDGRLLIDSMPGRGTRIGLHVPVEGRLAAVEPSGAPARVLPEEFPEGGVLSVGV